MQHPIQMLVVLTLYQIQNETEFQQETIHLFYGVLYSKIRRTRLFQLLGRNLSAPFKMQKAGIITYFPGFSLFCLVPEAGLEPVREYSH